MISSISAGVSPAITSSSSSRRGRIASARAISSRFFSGSDRFRASAGARWSSLTRASTAIASARGSDVWRFGPTTPAMTFSNTETSRNGWTIWKVRPIPSRARRCGGWPVISRPSNEMTPLVGRMKPEMVSNSVVLPAPFGPIRPTISWLPSSNETSSTARKPPNQRETSRTCSSGPLTSASAISRPTADPTGLAARAASPE